jgi:hypothetical protein
MGIAFRTGNTILNIVKSCPGNAVAQILRGCEGCGKKIFTDTMEGSPMDGRDYGSAVK